MLQRSISACSRMGQETHVHRWNAETLDGTGFAHRVQKERITAERGSMTKGKWLLLGAMILGLVVVLYLVLLCPSECH